MAYRMTHPDAPEREIEVDASRVRDYMTQGWQTQPGAHLPSLDDEADAGPSDESNPSGD